MDMSDCRERCDGIEGYGAANVDNAQQCSGHDRNLAGMDEDVGVLC